MHPTAFLVVLLACADARPRSLEHIRDLYAGQGQAHHLLPLFAIGGSVGSTLRQAADGRLFMGYASNAGHLAADREYVDVGNAQYNLATAENSCKFAETQPENDTFAFTGCDAVFDNMVGTANGTMRGHNFVWGQSNPSWLVNSSFDTTQLLDIMQKHISTVGGRYEGRFYCWDVVNEAVSGAWSLRCVFASG